jgi:hypothetical protein
MPHAPFRQILPTWLYVLITGCRWCEVPRGPHWASKSATQRWLQRWQTEGTLAAMQARMLGVAEEREMIRWAYGAVDGTFSPWKGGRRGRRPRGERPRGPHPQPPRGERDALGDPAHTGPGGRTGASAPVP